MNHTMYVDYMIKSCQNTAKGGVAKSNSQSGKNFMDFVAEKIAQGVDIAEAGNVKSAFIKDMTLEEYKQYIYDEITKLSFGNTEINSSFSVNITDEGFEAMKNDPEYERWVLDTLERDFNYHDPWGSLSKGRYVDHSFGAAKEEYIARSWSKGSYVDSRKAQRSFWKKREERRKKLQRQYAEVQAKRAMWKRVLESEKAQAIHENRMIARKESENGSGQQTGFVRTELSQAYAAYEAYAVASIAVSKMRH